MNTTVWLDPEMPDQDRAAFTRILATAGIATTDDVAADVEATVYYSSAVVYGFTADFGDTAMRLDGGSTEAAARELVRELAEAGDDE